MEEWYSVDDSIKRQRMSKYFINSAYDIIQREGVNSVTIRKVAKETGYNSATIYNYFENLDHLVFMASMKFIKQYTTDLLNSLEKVTDPLERIYVIWDTFCNYSFDRPIVYRSIFFPEFERDKHLCFKDFYILYPEDLVSTTNNTLNSMFNEYDIYERGLILLNECVKVGYFREEDISQLSDRIYIIYEGLLFRLIRGRIDAREAKSKFNTYVKHLINSYRMDTSKNV